MAAHNFPLFFVGWIFLCLVLFHMKSLDFIRALGSCDGRSPWEAKKPPELQPWNKLLNKVFQNSDAYCKGFVERWLYMVKELSCCLCQAGCCAMVWWWNCHIWSNLSPLQISCVRCRRRIRKNSSGMGFSCSYSSMLCSVPGAGSSPS